MAAGVCHGAVPNSGCERGEAIGEQASSFRPTQTSGQQCEVVNRGAFSKIARKGKPDQFESIEDHCDFVLRACIERVTKCCADRIDERPSEPAPKAVDLKVEHAAKSPNFAHLLLVKRYRFQPDLGRKADIPSTLRKLLGRGHVAGEKRQRCPRECDQPLQLRLHHQISELARSR